MNPAMDQHAELDGSLRGALAGQEFEFFYQPIIDIATCRCTRWKCRCAGRVPATA